MKFSENIELLFHIPILWIYEIIILYLLEYHLQQVYVLCT